MVWGLFGNDLKGGSSDPEMEMNNNDQHLIDHGNYDDHIEYKEQEYELDDSLVGKNILLRGGLFSKYQSSAHVLGMLGFVMSCDVDSST